MNMNIVARAAHGLRLVRAGLVVCCAASLLVGSANAAPQGEVDAIWNDPIFQRQFIAGYGINAELEPRVTQEEVAILEKIRPLMASGDLLKAEEALKKAMKPDCSAILDYTLGGMQFQQNRYPDSLVNYQKAVAKFPSFRRAWRNLGLIYARQSEFDDSIHAFVRMLELGGGDAYAFGMLGFAYASKQDYQPAEVSYRNALLLQPESTEWRLGLTRCVYRQQKYEDCAALLNVLIARYPEKAEFWMLEAQAYIDMKQPLKAAGNLEALDLLGKATVDSALTLGDIYREEKLMDLAARAYARAIELDPNQSVARPLHAAEVLAARGAASQARELVGRLHAAFDKRMDDGERQKLLKLEARLSMAEGGSSPETAAVLEEIVKLDPLDGEALMMLGQYHARNSEPDRAIFYYERAESLEAFEANAKVRHAQVLASMDRYADAVPLLRRAQEVKPREDIARLLEQVERIAKARR